MGIKIWCEECGGSGSGNKHIPDKNNPNQGVLVINSLGYCPACQGKGYIEKGCENCNNEWACGQRIHGHDGDNEYNKNITFCTAWEKKE